MFTGEMNDFDFAASFFFSRAVDYDDEEDEAVKEFDSAASVQSVSPVPTVSRHSSCISCSLVLVAVGPVAKGFVQSHILEEHAHGVIDEISCGTSESDEKSSSDTMCHLCQLKEFPKVVVVTCDVDVKPQETFLWTQQLFARVAVDSSSHVVILTSISVGSYTSAIPPGDLPECFLHSLATRSFSDVPAAPALPQPNLISGLPAQVLTYCEIHSISAVLYICCVQSRTLSPAALTAFRPLRQSSLLADIIVANESSKQRAVRLSSQYSSANYDSLYL